VHSSHPQTEQPAFTAWLEKAKRKWPRAIIHGSGRFAVAPMDGVNIHLFDDFEEMAEFMSTRPKSRLYHLMEERKPMRTIPEPFDVDEMRRERRERQQQ